MQHVLRKWRFGLAAALACVAGSGISQVREGGVDPHHLGTGDWVYVLATATNRLGGSVTAVTNVPSLMRFLKSQGLRYVIIKAGDGAALYPPQGAPQFTAELVKAAHDAGLWAFGYNRSIGTNIAGEIAIADHVFNAGADGFVFDAEAEWESARLPNNASRATQLCWVVRSHWPGKFLAYSPFAYRDSHATFPYKEFGFYCDAVMPQVYFVQFGETPTAAVQTMNSQWLRWQKGLKGVWTNAIKPLAPAGQGWGSTNSAVTPALVSEFVNALRTVEPPATPGGYQGVSWWRAELRPATVHEAIRTNLLGLAPTNALPTAPDKGRDLRSDGPSAPPPRGSAP
jgi:hypothetical protein